jgi:NAD(P)H-hydrate epimerase
VLKGPFTAVGTAQAVWVHIGPNPTLATAGTGDVLTGVIGGLLARGLKPEVAAQVGVFVHAGAGKTVGHGLAGGGLAASDLLTEVPRQLARLVAGHG